MATFKGDNSTISLVVEDNGWGKKPSTYAGGKYLQNNDGTFEAARNPLESEARTKNSELSGVRLGNNTVSGTFNVEVDPENYKKLFESLFYSQFEAAGTSQSVTGDVTADSAFTLVIPMTTAMQTALGANIGDPLMISGISDPVSHLNGSVVLIEKSSTTITVMHPDQNEDTLASTSVDCDVTRIQSMRFAKKRLSFNAEETLSAEDGVTKARFMTVGAITTGVSFELPQEGNVKAAFSMIGSGKHPSKLYQNFDPSLVASEAAHTGVVEHVKYTPMVLQDGAILSGSQNTRCIWLSGSVGIENGTEPYYTGCSYDAQGANSGKFRVNVNYEALFQSEDDYITFTEENASRVMLRLKDRTSDKCIILYLPSFKATTYSMKNAVGLVTASISGSAEIDVAAINSCVIGLYVD